MSNVFSDFEGFTQSWWPYIISFVISLISAIRFYFGGTYCSTSARIDGKCVIITGASSGIGLETAKELAKRGANLILAIRNAEKGIKLLEEIRKLNKGGKHQIKVVDVSDLSSIRNFVDDIKLEHDKVDVLINNAGVISNKSIGCNQQTFLVNYLGPFLLTHLLLPLLNKSNNGRVINVSALAHYNGKLKLNEEFGNSSGSQEAFAESKLALTVFTKHMAQKYKDTNITFNSVNPGLVRNTNHWNDVSIFNSSLLTRFSLWPWMWLFLKSPKQGCQTIVYVAVEPTLHKVSGCYFSDCEIKDPADVVNDLNKGKTLYKKTCEFVSLDPDYNFLL